MLSRNTITYVGMFAATLVALIGVNNLSAANSGERRLAIYNIHTKETVDIVYMRDGKRIPEAIKRLHWIMRDYRENEPTTMDPKLIDLLWEIHTELGSREPIHLISGYRSPKTNAMLRRTRGGQGKKSKHMYGKAADVHFPDVPVRRLRYSALVRQRGGVGYYPTSGLPFVHVDTGRVRHWPRMGRYELALLFPNGRSLHRPRGGRRITKRDVRIARSKHKHLSTQVAAFFDARGQPAPPRPIRVAAATRSQFTTKVTFANTGNPRATTPRTAKARRNVQIASLGPVSLPAPSLQSKPAHAARPLKAPVLTTRPRLADRPTTLKPKSPSNTDRRKLTELFSLASLVPSAKRLFDRITGTSQQTTAATNTAPAPRPEHVAKIPDQPATATPPVTIESLLAAFENDPSIQETETATPTRTAALQAPPAPKLADRSGWVTAPAYDDEHPDELFYRPFPLAPLMTLTSSPHDPAIAKMVHPDVAGTLDFIDDSLSALPMKLRPAKQLAALMWSNNFTGLTTQETAAKAGNWQTTTQRTGPNIASRTVRTSTQ